MKVTILPAVLLAAAGLATACGGSSNTSSNTSSDTAASTPASSGGAYGNAPAQSTGTPAASGSALSIKATKSDDLGTFLTDSSGRSLYLWKADKGDSSTCSGPCAQAWPPVTTTGAPTAGTGVKASLLGTTKRSDGSTEVTYGGHPLYYFVGDKKPGDTAGQASEEFGADWLVVAPTGEAIDKGDDD
jgi:predicted lipoprotein with Yx(FWY)xxD motif